MGTIANSINQQIDKLKQRGMALDYEEAKIKEILLDVGYYRLGFYWNPFEKNKNHDFEDGTNFSNVVSLYYLDVDLRNILLRYINRIEINFRTKIVYYVSNKYKELPAWFVSEKVLDISFTGKINMHYDEEFKKNNKTIRLHHEKYGDDGYAPAWKTLEFFTFGAILKIYKSLLDEGIKQRISECYGIRNIEKFTNIMSTIVLVRNICAHGGVLFDFSAPKGIAVLPTITFNNNNRHSLDSAIKVISLILKSVSESRGNDFDIAISELFKKNKENAFINNIIETKVGYVY